MPTRIDAAADALIRCHREIWPGSRPAKPEAIKLATAVLDAVGGLDADEIADLHDLAEQLADEGNTSDAATVSKAACLLDPAAYRKPI